MFNSGVRGRRAPDNFGTLSSQTKYIQQKSPQPSITSWSIVGTDDTALNTAGGQTVLVNGTGFASGAAVTVNGQTISPVTVVSPTQLSFTSIALAGGSYSLIVYNSTGGAAILVPGLIYSAVPTWTTSAGSIGTTYETTPISTSVVATSDSAITYSLSSGSLPSGATLYANGVITGTSPVESGSTTYTFAIKAEDAELQDTTRTFTLTINTDVVTWSAPANNTSYTANINEVASNVVLSATSAAGYGITYSANTLPTGLSLAGNTISGTPTVVANSSTLLTATASTTNRSATRTINWIIRLGSDPYFNLTTLLLNGETSSNYWIQDASTNKFAVTVVGDTRPMAFSPYETVWSNYFDGSGDYLTVAGNAAFLFPGDHTIECWITWDGTYSAAGREIYATGGSGSADQFGIFSGSGLFYAGLSSGYTPPTNVWTHIAISRSGSAIRFFGNGVLQFTGTNGSSIGSNSATVHIGIRGDGFHPWLGYISNLRIVKGTALYIENFIPSTSPLTAISGTSLLTCQSNRLLDNSTNNFAVTKNGDVTVNNFGPFAETDLTTGSGYFDGTGDFIDAGNNSAFAFGTGDFTVECWIFTAVASDSPIYEGRANGSTSDGFTLTAFSSSVIRIFSGSALISSSGTNYLNQWTHIAVCRISSVTTLYINGVSAGTSGSLGNNATGSAVIGGGRYAGGTTVNASFTGYISNFRIIKGTAVYTSAFTPPTSPLTAIANTSLLTLQNRFGENNNRFVDTSGMNSIVTKFANATQGTFSPFSQTGWSGYFDGTGDYLSTPSGNTAFNFSATKDMTFECYFYATQSLTTNCLFDINECVPFRFVLSSTGLIWQATGSGGTIASASNTWVLNRWYHLACVRSLNTVYIFIDGILSVSASYSDNWTYAGSSSVFVGCNRGDTWFFSGYISNVRLLKGTALYTANFTPSPSPLTAIANTSLLTCQSNRFIDNSANNFTLTRFGDTSVQAFSPFSPAIITPTSYSGYFDGTTDYVTQATNSSYGFGTGDFTIEFWLYLNSTGLQTVYSNLTSPSSTNPHIYVSGSIRYYTASADRITGSSLNISQWYHIALSRASGSTRLFIDGTQSGSTYTDGNNYDTTAPLGIGTYWNAGSPVTSNTLFGYMSNLRVVKGTAVYTTNFTPPTSPLTAIANTSVLTCQSNRFIDNSANNFTLTANGETRPTQFNPFGNTSLTGADAAYSLTNVGGSIYFDGTGDYLTATTSFNTSTTWTIEGWCYFTSSANNDVFLNASSDRLYIQWIGTTFYLGDASVNNISFASKPINIWFHLAVVKNSSTYTVYFNGVVMGTSTTALITDTVTTWQIGARTSQSIVARGYISNLRVIAGVALYTSAFAPPVAPLTSIAGSILLLNGTNSGLIDYTSKNVLETFGNAQLSAAITKFGNASIYFDGNGDYLTVRTSPLLDFGTGNFTVEFWWYPTTVATDQGFLGGGGGCYDFVWRTSTGFNLGRINVAFDNTFAFTAVANIWYHVAYSRSGTSLRVFVNGTQVGSTATNSISYGTNGTTPVIGGSTTVDRLMTGYIDDLRITNGFARYTANFTPPTSAFITF